MASIIRTMLQRWCFAFTCNWFRGIAFANSGIRLLGPIDGAVLDSACRSSFLGGSMTGVVCGCGLCCACVVVDVRFAALVVGASNVFCRRQRGRCIGSSISGLCMVRKGVAAWLLNFWARTLCSRDVSSLPSWRSALFFTSVLSSFSLLYLRKGLHCWSDLSLTASLTRLQGVWQTRVPSAHAGAGCWRAHNSALHVETRGDCHHHSYHRL
jgi:hypothetical protein